MSLFPTMSGKQSVNSVKTVKNMDLYKRTLRQYEILDTDLPNVN